MTQDLFGFESEAEVRTERAQQAVRAFRSMQPGLTGYAQAITGRRNVTVELAQGAPRTDGKKIYFKPPISLGDLTPHERMRCERRDPETAQQLCPACRTREEVLISIYHEIAHIVFGTFREPSDEMKRKAVERAIEEQGTKYAARIKAAWDSIPPAKKNDYLNLSSLISPFLPVLVNALEDARVDEGMFKARKGTRVMFDAYTQSVFRNGIPMDDGTFIKWSERPLNSQAIIGVFVLACRYNYEGWFAPEVEEALGDEKLRELVGRVDTLRSAEGSYNLAFPILARLRELGFCLNPDEEPDEPEEEQDEDESEEDDAGESDDSGEPQDEGEGQSDEDGPSSDEAADGGSGDEDSEPEDGQDGQEPDGGVHDAGDGDSGDGDDEDSSESEDSESSSDEADESRDEAGSDGAEEAESDGHGEADSSPSASEPGSADGDDEAADEQPSDQSGRADQPVDQPEDGDPADSELTDEGDDEVVDSGADEGKGGTRSDLEYGTADDALQDVQVFGQHEVILDPEPQSADEAADEAAVERAIIQGQYFEKPSAEVEGVREHKYGQPYMENGFNMSAGWLDEYGQNDPVYQSRLYRRLGITADTDVPESILGPALLEMRRTFSDNARAKMERHLRSGKINQRVLGKRAWAGDDRLFQKKRMPGRKSYAVLIGIDISGSTVGVNIALAKRAAFAQAELCARAGIDFAVYAHTANPSAGKGWGYDLWLDIYEIKSFDQPWNDTAQEALKTICSDAENLDGHTIEYYRKMIERHSATDKIILYYSDGKMPAANHDEELEILRREIAYCKANQITLMGVGIRTDSPRRHGLNTVQVNDDSDIPQVVRHLQSALLHRR